ncbi:MAG: hypothetical protein J0L92_38060, partial [Deltaproteobacteria bacterium]|nr:hypothetical protein [Deltaproteobacteria bacterium]
CTRELGNPIRVNVPCAPNDRMGACDIGTHVLYSYWVPDASADAYRRLCGTTSGRFLAGGGMGEPGADSVHPEANATITVGQVVLYLCSDRCTATYIARVVDVLPDGRVTVEYRGDRETVARDHLWVGSFTPVPDGLGNSEADDFPTITETPLPVGTEVWAKDTWWYRGRVAEDTGGARLGVDLYGFVGEPQQFTRRNVRLHR